MSSLYPDETYCTSEIGRTLFKPKTEWACSASVVDVSQSKGFAGTHIEYHIQIKCIPRNSVDWDSRVFLLKSRYRELNKLHANLSKLHKQLYLRGSFPPFPSPKLLFSSDPAVVDERRASTESFLSFVLDSEVLRKARALHEFVEGAEELVNAGIPAAYEVLYAENIMDAPLRVETCIRESTPSSTHHIAQSDSASGDFMFPDLPMAEINASDGYKPHRATAVKVFPPYNSIGADSLNEDYLVQAAKLVATAQRSELEHEYELAFQCYKNAARSMILGAQSERDPTIRNKVRLKTAKYLQRAETIYKAFLYCDDGAFSCDSLLKCLGHLQDPNIFTFKGSNQSLKNYDIINVLPDFNSSSHVFLVQERSTHNLYVIKILEKGQDNTNGRILLPTAVPHMVELFRFFETDTALLVMLEYVPSGCLWAFLSSLFKEPFPASSKNESPYRQIATEWYYKGSHVDFSVGIDFDRIAQFHDSVQSTDDPSEVEILCTIGEDCAGEAARSISGDYFISAHEGSNVTVYEESPADLNFHQSYHADSSVRSCDSLAQSVYKVRELLSKRKPIWPSSLLLPECLIVHWIAQLVSWFYVMHFEHGENIGDFTPRRILINNDGNVVVSYYGLWNGRPKIHPSVDYACPESCFLGWQPTAQSDVWSVGVILYELLTCHKFSSVAFHGYSGFGELPLPENISLSLVSKDLLSRMLAPWSERCSWDDVRSHAFFASIDWSLYDNPHLPSRNRCSDSCDMNSIDR